MSVKFQNFAYWYWNERKKPVFVPNEKSYNVGYELKELLEERVSFDPYYFHMRPGGHVAALHGHRVNSYFARADIKNFYYEIARNRVARALYEVRLPKAGYYAKFSCVKSPYGDPRYCLPYGFVQSPVLATLVMSRSALGTFLKQAQSEVTVSVYMDDIAISSSSYSTLEIVFAELIEKIKEANFPLNYSKTVRPTDCLQLFNCNLEHNYASVTEIRRSVFFSETRTPVSEEAFKRYCAAIERGNGARC